MAYAPGADRILEALRLNALRLSAQLPYMTPDYAGGTFATRHDLVHLLLSHQLAAGTALQDWRDVAGELLQGKALGNRLQAQRSAALRRSTNPAVASLQALMNTLDPNASLNEYYRRWSLDTQLQALLAPDMAPLQLTGVANCWRRPATAVHLPARRVCTGTCCSPCWVNVPPMPSMLCCRTAP